MFKATIDKKDIFSNDKILSVLVNKEKLHLFMNNISTKKDDKKYTIEITEYKEKRSLSANNLHWLYCQKIADVLNVDNETVHFEMLIKYGYSDKMKILQSAVPRLKQSYKYVTIEKEYQEEGYDWAIVKVHHRSMFFNTKEMSRLLQGTIDDAKDLGIDTITKEEQDSLIKSWGC